MSSSLTPKKNLENELVAETRELVGSLKLHYMAIAENLYRIREAWTGTVDEWVDFYENDLELHKSTVSKMLKVGPASIAYGWRNEQVSIEKLYNSLNRHKEEPQLALAEAKTWTKSDEKDQVKEDCKSPEFGLYCKHCWATKEKHV